MRPVVGVLIVIVLTFGLVQQANAEPDVVAHQGYGNSTYIDYRTAAAGDVVLEGDMQLTKDNKVIIHHDAKLSVKCKGKKAIKKLKWSQIRKCNPNIIRLETLLVISKSGDDRVSLEFKKNGGKKWTKTRMKRVYKAILNMGMLTRTEIYSFDAGLVSKWRNIDRKHYTKTGLNVNKKSNLDVTKIKRAGGRVAVHMNLVDSASVEYLQSQGMYVAIYTVTNEAQMVRALSLSPDAIISDIPPTR